LLSPQSGRSNLNTMKIAIDARLFGPEGTGIGKYIERLLENLEIIDEENEYFVVLRKANYPFYNPKKANFRKSVADVKWYSVGEQLLLPAVLLKIKPDLVHFPHFNVPLLYPGKFVVTIHDLITSQFNSAATTHSVPIHLLKSLGYEMTVRSAAARAQRILTPSKIVKNKVQKEFSLPENKLVTTYEAVDNIFLEAPNEKISQGKERQLLAKYGIKKPFLLSVGSAYPHKNLTRLVEALPGLSKVNLVYVGSRNSFVDRLIEKARQFGVEKRLFVVGFVPQDELVDLYKLAVCYVAPSLSEGFGLPALEAMAVGCPVAASNIEVFKEIYGEAPIYFNPRKPEDIAEKISQVAESREQRAGLRKKGFEQVKKYSWKKMAEETLAVYEAAR